MSLASSWGAVICLAAIGASYCYEVVARYFFAAPTIWADSLVSYALCGMIFLALPELTRRQAHITLTLLLEKLSPPAALTLNRITSLVAAGACGFAAWFSAIACIAQYDQGIQTMASWPMPKWPLSFIIAFNLGSAALHFMRHAVGPVGARVGFTEVAA
jgi:TRAP-type C4-dicarboxylate transport system permease small subunit